MSNAVTHILIVIILIELFREYFIKDNRKFPRYYILIAAIGAIIPDFDIILSYLLYPFGFMPQEIHRTFLHTIFVPLILLLIGIFIWKLNLKNSKFGKRHLKLPVFFYLFSFGSFVHLILDAVFAGGIQPLYPFNYFFINYNIFSFLPEVLQKFVEPTIDGILLLFWICWMEFKLKITDYF